MRRCHSPDSTPVCVPAIGHGPLFGGAGLAMCRGSGSHARMADFNRHSSPCGATPICRWDAAPPSPTGSGQRKLCAKRPDRARSSRRFAFEACVTDRYRGRFLTKCARVIARCAYRLMATTRSERRRRDAEKGGGERSGSSQWSPTFRPSEGMPSRARL